MLMTPTTCPLDCPDACGALAETDDAGRFIRLRGNPQHPYSKGVLCSKTSSYHELVNSPERLRTPLIRGKGGFREASWDEACALIKERVAPLAGEKILALQYAGSMGMVARNFPMRMMFALGATTHDEGVCDSTSTAGYEVVLGDPVGLDLLEADKADGIVLWGSDVKRTIQHLFPRVKARAKTGVPVFVIDVYRTETVEAVERWGGRGLILRPGTDSILALALARDAFERGAVDRDFLEAECLGAEEFEAHLRAAPTLEEAAQTCGLVLDDVRALGRLMEQSKSLFLRTGSGWTRRTNGAMGMRSVCSLAAVLGKADRVHYESPAVFRFDADCIARPDLRPVAAPPVLTQVALGTALESGRFQAVFVWGHNPALTLPDSARVQRGLAREDVFLVVHEQFMTATAELADVVLPATFFVEHSDVYKSYGHRVAQFGRRAAIGPEGPLSNVRAFAKMARAMDLDPATWDESEESLCEVLLEQVSEHLSEEQMHSLRGGEPTMMEVSSKAATGPQAATWPTPSGKVELISAEAEALGQPAMATWCADPGIGGDRAFWLISAPSKHTHNTTFLNHPRHAARNRNPRCFLDPSDMLERGWKDGQALTLHNDFGRITLTAEGRAGTPRGCVRVDGFPRPADVPEGTSINVLASPQVSDLGNGTTYYSTRVDIEAS
jgi:anaerobic selenocysteine-containing dehydrogenase